MNLKGIFFQISLFDLEPISLTGCFYSLEDPSGLHWYCGHVLKGTLQVRTQIFVRF